MDKLLGFLPAALRPIVMAGIIAFGLGGTWAELKYEIADASETAKEAKATVKSYEKAAQTQRDKINERIDTLTSMVDANRTETAINSAKIDDIKQNLDKEDRKLDQILELTRKK